MQYGLTKWPHHLPVSVSPCTARIGQGQLIPAVESVAAQVAGSGAAQKAEEDLAAQAPDHFLDPIMSSLMTDPVLLPTSGIVCDRSTIAR